MLYVVDQMKNIFDDVIRSIILVCCQPVISLFDLVLAYSYISAHYTLQLELS